MKTPALILVLGLALVSTSFAVDPPPDGGYPNGNTAEGEDALFSLTTGFNNTAIGFNALYSHTTGNGNTGVGYLALAANTSGAANTAVGVGALGMNTVPYGNVAIGAGALAENTTGNLNTAVGISALGLNVSAFYDTAIGGYALYSEVSNGYNTAVGYNALYSNSTGTENTAIGYGALSQNATGLNNTANGLNALGLNTKGNNNTAYGYHSLLNNATGSGNIALGYNAGNNLTGDLNIDIGNSGVSGESSTIRVGRQGQQTATYVAGISGITVASGVGVVIGANGQLGTMTSSARFKDKIQPMSKASDAILSLKPVTFCYKKELDPDAIPQFGLVAEDVAKVDPNLVAKDEQGKPYTVRYEAVNAMLLNEFLKEHKKVEELEKQLQRMAARLDAKGL